MPIQKWHARFIGRLAGAIGITYRIEAFADGATEEAARLDLYRTYESLHALSLVPLVWRYVITVERNGSRVLAFATQGRYTFATHDEAVAHLNAISTNNSAEILALFPGRAVRGIWCWPGHFDPIGIFAEDDQEGQ